MGVPINLHPIVQFFEADEILWHRLLDGSMPIFADLPADIQRDIIRASVKREILSVASKDLRLAMHFSFTLDEFNRAHKSLASCKTSGPSGLTSAQVKYWDQTLLNTSMTSLR
jgi:hypothetical protein